VSATLVASGTASFAIALPTIIADDLYARPPDELAIAERKDAGLATFLAVSARCIGHWRFLLT
jgi:hypothetical protein